MFRRIVCRWRPCLVAALAILLISIAISYRWAFGFGHPGKRFECFVVQGSFYVNTFPPGMVQSEIEPVVGWKSGFGVTRAALYLPWVPLRPKVQHHAPGRWSLEFPLSLPVGAIALTIVLPMGVVLWRRHFRPPPGVCVKCRYDLRHNVSGVCPECGAAIRDRSTNKST
jgi:hypothetical protein